ncbi:MAG: YfcC family protein, partial [Actinomycetes bacterium]|nr:YfcC family protein [Actinomycetes bacterium]
PWDSINPSWTFFVDFTAWLTGIPVLGALLGKDMVPLGAWYFNELNMMLLVLTLICGCIMGYKVSKTIDIFINGCKAVVGTAFIVPLARGIQVIMSTGLIMPTILHAGENILKHMSAQAFAVLSYVMYLPMAALMPSSSGLAAATMSIMSSLSGFAHLPSQVTIIAYLMALGLVKMIAPTSIIVMTCIPLVKVEYSTWVKFIWKFLVFLFLFCCAFLLVATLLS